MGSELENVEEQEEIQKSMQVVASVVSLLPAVGGPMSAILDIVLIFWPGEDQWEALEHKIEDEMGTAFEEYHATRELNELGVSESIFKEYLADFKHLRETGALNEDSEKRSDLRNRLDDLHQKLLSEREQLFEPPMPSVDKHGLRHFSTFPSFIRYVTLHLAVLTELRRFPSETIDINQNITDLFQASQEYLKLALLDKFRTYVMRFTVEQTTGSGWHVFDSKGDLPIWFTRKTFTEDLADTYRTSIGAAQVLKDFVPLMINAGTLFHFDGLKEAYPDQVQAANLPETVLASSGPYAYRSAK